MCDVQLLISPIWKSISSFAMQNKVYTCLYTEIGAVCNILELRGLFWKLTFIWLLFLLILGLRGRESRSDGWGFDIQNPSIREWNRRFFTPTSCIPIFIVDCLLVVVRDFSCKGFPRKSLFLLLIRCLSCHTCWFVPILHAIGVILFKFMVYG